MIVDAAGISTISGAMLKPKKIEGHNHGNYLVAVHRVAPTTKKNLSTIAADLDAFNAQKDTGYKTFYQYLWHICAAEIDG